MDRELLLVARRELERYFRPESDDIEIKDEWLNPGASFVTLTKSGNLRGCIGSLKAVSPLIEDIKSNALAAALNDPRFPPLKEEELKEIKIEISILSNLTELNFESEEDIHKQLKPYEMGLVLEFGLYRGTFLPQVWEYYPKPKDFLNNLKMKAGLGEEFYHNNMKIMWYSVEKCQE